ncbi:uncharacterized protein LOC109833172 isoform X2 [Asparagus officinalis]|uniref:uncharacterized protein LOC109833172 isoform X2 n=1 Tax=Asparagus officinalis TaxID=4686 RepID=UPI00098E496D|nr:uncharacterized protein LOC109833172 isoform X2 [Asparagus officinalis]
MFYEFQHNTRLVKPIILHFQIDGSYLLCSQLRNLAWLPSKHDVYIMSHYSVMHWSALTIWKELENENPTFFRLYNMLIVIKKQIEKYNELLVHQKNAMNQRNSNGDPSRIITANVSNQDLPNGVPSVPVPNGEQIGLVIFVIAISLFLFFCVYSLFLK